MRRREFLELLSIAGLAGAALRPRASLAQAASELYDLPAFGNVSLLHITDTHAQLLPVYFREPFEKREGVQPGTALAYAHTYPEFEALARRYGKVGGFAHLATLLKRLRAGRPHALLLDGGDSWQGSATALWTRGADMMGAQQKLGVDYMTAHWEFTYGQERVKESKLPLLAHNATMTTRLTGCEPRLRDTPWVMARTRADGPPVRGWTGSTSSGLSAGGWSRPPRLSMTTSRD